MNFLAPAALGLGLLALPIILLYMLRLRRQEHLVSSTFLWRELARDQAANIPWQRLRRNLLLFLQLLILGGLIFALARPYFRVDGATEGTTFILLDASASMQATDMPGERSRYDAAREQAARLIGSGQVTLIQVGRSPTVLASASSDRRLLQQALDKSQAENSAADWPAALALAAASAESIQNPQFVIISDGGLPESLPALPGEVTFFPIGQADDNLAVAALASRSTPDGEMIFAGIQNTGAESQSAIVGIYNDAQLIDSRRLTIEPGGRQNINFNLPNDYPAIEVRIEQEGDGRDYLSLDNRAWLLPEGQQASRVLLVTEGNLFLERFFSLLPGYQVYRAGVEESAAILSTAEADGEMFDLVVFDSMTLPENLPATNILVFNPQPHDGAEEPVAASQFGGIDIRVGPPFADITGTQISESLLTDNVDWGTVTVNQAQLVESEQLQPVIDTNAGSLLLAGEDDGRRIALFTFDLRQSDLPLQIAFPIIMTNIVSWLNPGVITTSGNIQPGDPVTLILDTRTEAVVVEKPDGSRSELSINPGSPTLLFNQTEQTGHYRVFYRQPTGDLFQAGGFVVNFFNQAESQIRPIESILVGQTTVAPSEGTGTGRQEIWPWLLALAFIMLLIEWWFNFPRAVRKPAIKTP